MKLDDRKKSILESVIRDYVETAEPVGSRAIVRKHSLNISAATVRNEMADLEDMGYLEQPHTSAGRIPSEKGFRYYVDCMMEKENLSDEEMEVLDKIVQGKFEDWNDVIQGVGQFISQITNYASFIIVPSIKFSQFQYMQILPVQEGQALVIIVTDIGLLMHRKITIPDSIKPDELQLIGDLFNQVFQGKRMDQLRRTDLQILRDNLKRRRQVIDNALNAIEALLDHSTGEKVVISGALNILKEPEFKDLNKLSRILSILDEDVMVKGLIPDEISEEVCVRIGKENEIIDIQEMSLVYAGYKTSGPMGTLGLIGPVRMEYGKAAGTVESVSSIIEKILVERFL